jgi:hypothetical protein
MNIPLTPALMVLQAHTPGLRKIDDAANEIMALLDDFTFGEEETRILEILAEFPPEDFMRCLEHLSQCTTLEGWPRKEHEVSYLERLYVDMNGAEFDALCEMTRSRLLALKCGSPERWAEVVEKALLGETTPEIPVSVDYGPAKITSPRTLSRRSYPCDMKFLADGSIAGKWMEHVTWFYDFGTPRPFRVELTDLFVAHYIHHTGKNEILTLLDIKNMSDELHRNFWFTTVNVAGILLSGGLIAAAKGAARKALVAFCQVAVPAAGQYITEHDEEIRKLKYGREFIISFQILSLFMAGFGLYRLFSPAGKSILDKLGKLKNDLVSGNRSSAVAKEAGKLVEALEDALVNVKKHVVDKGLAIAGAKPSSSSRIMNSLRGRKPFHPQVPPPAISGGKCIATGKSEFEMLHEMKKYKGDRTKLEVFQKGDDFLLAEYPAPISTLPPGTTRPPTGYDRWSFTKLIDIVDDYDSAKKKLILAARLNEAEEIEVGIYQKIVEGDTRFAVINGTAGRVRAPADGWIAVGHYHHEAGRVLGYHMPAITDVADTLREAGKDGKKLTEIIFSRNARGELVEIKYTVDPSNKTIVVDTLGGGSKTFSRIYPDPPHHPEDLSLKLDTIDKLHGLTELQKLTKKAQVFRDAKLDPNVDYAAWWATFFP